MSKINFAAINDFCMANYLALLDDWLPLGKKNGSEWVSKNPNRSDAHEGSFTVSYTKGVWKDFATDDGGSDPISLYAYLFCNDNQGEAAKKLIEKYDLESPVSKPDKKTTSSKKPVDSGEWQVIKPPANPPAPHVAHSVRGKPECIYTYRDLDGSLIGYIYRFVTSTGGKELCPLTWCKNTKTGAQRWHWKQFAEPRPLYGLDKLAKFADDCPVFIVEGEKCADAAKEYIADYPVLTWPGGGKVVHKVDWSVLKGRTIYIWPDCDSQRDKEGVLLPEEKQPGLAAAAAIVDILKGYDCTVYQLQLPPPGQLKNGWDVVDAIADGYAAELTGYLLSKSALVFKHSAPALPVLASAGGETADIANAKQETLVVWHKRMKRSPSTDAFTDNMYNVATILSYHPRWAGCVATNTFSHKVEIIKPLPTGHKCGEWDSEHDLALGEWMAHEVGCVIKHETTIVSGVRLAANALSFNPPMDYLNALPVWDENPRLDFFLADVLGIQNRPYLQLAGRFFIMGMVARIFNPGCKFDYMLILQGAQGIGKSTFFRLLASPWFSESPFEIGSNDGNMAIQGTWLHEMAELDALGKARETLFKSFLAITHDKYRVPYQPRAVEKPRVCVFGGTTNSSEFLRDLSGNRRVWPVKCAKVNSELLEDYRPLLFAEAIARIKAGEKFYPDRDEERDYFVPEQDKWLISDAWLEIISNFINDPLEVINNYYTNSQLLRSAMGKEYSKMDVNNQDSQKVGRIMSKLGWEKRQINQGKQRIWVYVRPESEQVKPVIPGLLS